MTVNLALIVVAARRSLPLSMLTVDLGGHPLSTIGGGKTAPDRAAFFNGLSPDNLGAVLGAAQMRGASGVDFLIALAIAYQVQTRLSDVAPVRDKGFDHHPGWSL